MRNFIVLIQLILFSEFVSANLIIIHENKIFLVDSKLNESVINYSADEIKKYSYFEIKSEKVSKRQFSTGLETQLHIPDFKLFDQP